MKKCDDSYSIKGTPRVMKNKKNMSLATFWGPYDYHTYIIHSLFHCSFLSADAVCLANFFTLRLFYYKCVCMHTFRFMHIVISCVVIYKCSIYSDVIYYLIITGWLHVGIHMCYCKFVEKEHFE